MLRLVYHAATTIPVEAEIITPDRLAGLSALEIAHLPLQHGNAQAPLGDFFSVTGSASDQHLVIEGDCQRVKLLGAGMKSGRLTIHGDAGMHLGAEMSGGEIHVHGHVHDWAGAEMQGGLLHVHGNAGHLAGAGYRGARHGMRGGVLLIDGNAGAEIGSSMRRGLIAVGGSTGDFAGVGMIAGSLFIFGQTGSRTGAGMKRGTIALFGPPAALLPTFRYDCTYEPIFMKLYLRQLARWSFAPAMKQHGSRYQRYSGDLVARRGLGEILIHGS